MLLVVSLHLLLPLSSPDSHRVLRWNAESLPAKSTKLLHFLSMHSVDNIFIQKSNLNSSSFFWITGFTHASGGIILFVRQGLSFLELSTCSFSSLDPYSNYVEVSILLNSSSSLSFFDVYATFICSSPTDSRTDSFSLFILSSSRNLFILGDFNCHYPLWDTEGTSAPVEMKYLIGSSLLISSHFNEPDIPTFLYRSSSTRFSPDISFAPSSLALSCS